MKVVVLSCIILITNNWSIDSFMQYMNFMKLS